MADEVRVFAPHHHSPPEDAFTARLVADLEAAGGMCGRMSLGWALQIFRDTSTRRLRAAIGSSSPRQPLALHGWSWNYTAQSDRWPTLRVWASSLSASVLAA